MDADLLVYQQLPNGLAIITLNRPSALNAINHSMVISLFKQLQLWAHDSTVKMIVIKATPGRAFCAGGDIRSLYEAQLHQDTSVLQFYFNEFRLNYLIHYYPKPYISLLDGITMGGGAGISIHGVFRIATENFSFAMPETAIGYFPDVGASYFLNRCPGKLGIYLGLTGARLSAADALYAGIVTHFIPQALLAKCETVLEQNTPHMRDITEHLQMLTVDPGTSILPSKQPLIDRCFNAESIEQILENLTQEQDEWAQQTYKLLLTRSPTSLKVTLKLLQLTAVLPLAECLKIEYRLAARFFDSADFHEGIRAAIIDKDQQPLWQPANLQAVSDKTVNDYFKPMPAAELELADLVQYGN